MERAGAVAIYRQGEDACVEVLLSLASAVEALQGQVAVLESRMAELEARLRENSRNSSRPPSSDGLGKPPPKPRSRRRRSGRKPGGQPGSEGHHLAQVADPDEVVSHEPAACRGCGGGLEDAELVGAERRQVFDLPPETRLVVCEHRSTRRRCDCGTVTAGAFPEPVRAPAQYGPRLRAFVLYLAVYQHLPYERIQRLLADRYGAHLSTGTLQAIVQAGAAGLGPFLEQVRLELVASPVVHVDETGARAAGKLHWVHEATTRTLALYRLHAKRGKDGIDDLGVLTNFTGTVVHDGFTPYRHYTRCSHALCNGHHLRELAAAEEQGQPWASELACLLVELNTAVEAAKEAGQAALDPAVLARYQRQYRALLAAGYELNPEPDRTGRRGRPKQGKTRSLLLRLDRYQDDALRFATDLNVPFDNNQGERDLRMIKLQQKISGCWRSSEGAASFLALRSYIQTARKQGQDILAVLQDAADGRPWLPAGGET
ncbi:IS66 family transposase [bacterium]|nr:MAG: IS66 family transposase [bacterium]